MSNNYHYNKFNQKVNNYNYKKGAGNQKNNDYKKAQEENKKLKMELNQKNNVLKDYNNRIKILQNELNQLQRQKNNTNRNNTNRNNNRGRSNNNVRINNNDFYDPFDNIFNSGALNNLLFDSPFGLIQNRNIQRINPNFNPGDYEDYYGGNNINNIISGPRNNNYINNFGNLNGNDESKIEQEIIDQLYPDPDKMTYEQLLELEENVGSVSKGLTKNQIKKIPKIKYNKNRFGKDDNKCVVCQYEFKNGEEVTKLSCGHLFHSDCVDTWLSKNKVCPMCHKEIIVK